MGTKYHKKWNVNDQVLRLSTWFLLIKKGSIIFRLKFLDPKCLKTLHFRQKNTFLRDFENCQV